ncbi:hypothetical protein NRBB51_1480 [Bifidobacterium breve]|uniref:Uncharacterized protein n=1 Tax=Bifidobacterium breve TaxID=1685 RepID=A0AAN1ICV0_BIFBR|nr:hypothetical protein NRBB51_1480 [Bifidobacterium breve]
MVGFLSVRRWHFNPRSPDGERHITTATAAANNAFQSTLPGWGATPPTLRGDYGRYHFNPRSPDGERPSLSNHCSCVSRISIHAPRMGSDHLVGYLRFLLYISIHAPRMGSDLRWTCRRAWSSTFQSTLPGWGATAYLSHCHRSPRFQSTLPGWGATYAGHADGLGHRHFNPRSPDGERPRTYPTATARHDFNPRSPDGERRSRSRVRRAGGNFNPRSPDGERPASRSAGS